MITILTNARERAQNLQLPYAGALTPTEAVTCLAQDNQVVLVDVRTRAEWQWVGQPSLPPAQYKKIEWNQSETGMRNPHFAEELQLAVPKANLEKPVLFLCRSGVRSHAAAELATSLGYQAFNILEGFEGDKDTHGHRKTVNGWCAAQLPWQQS